MKKQNLSVPEFCEAVGVRRTTAWQLIRDAEVDVVRIGRRTLITKASAKALIARSTVKKTPDVPA